MGTDIRELPRCCVAQDFLQSRRVFPNSCGTMKRYKPRSTSFSKLRESTAYNYGNKCERSLKRKAKRAVLVTRKAKDYSVFSLKFYFDNWSRKILDFWRFRATRHDANAKFQQMQMVTFLQNVHSNYRSAKLPDTIYSEYIMRKRSRKSVRRGRRL